MAKMEAINSFETLTNNSNIAWRESTGQHLKFVDFRM
jgi:hypothetical protein